MENNQTALSSQEIGPNTVSITKQEILMLRKEYLSFTHTIILKYDLIEFTSRV